MGFLCPDTILSSLYLTHRRLARSQIPGRFFSHTQEYQACFNIMEPNPNGENPRFSANDLVWGKIKSHPWWPGQIIDPKQASEYATNKQKQDHFLVAYFSDKSFAWVQESQLKHFEPHFSEMENQKGSLVFDIAVSDAVSEYSRRVELSLACNCLKDEILSGLKNNEIFNRGVREGTYNEGVIVNDFLPRSFVNFIRACALCPVDKASMLELARVTGQLKAFNGWKGTNELYVLDTSSVDFVENDEMVEAELNVKSDKKRGRPSKVQMEAEENGTGGYGSERKGKKLYVKKARDEKHIEVELDSCEKLSNVEESGAKSEKKRGKPLDKIEKKNVGEGNTVKRKYVGKAKGQSSVQSEKIKGKPHIVQTEAQENRNEGIGSEVKDKQMAVQKIDDENYGDVGFDPTTVRTNDVGVVAAAQSEMKIGGLQSLQEEAETKEKEAFGEVVCIGEGESNVKSEKKKGRPRKIRKEGEAEHEGIGGEKNGNVEIEPSTKSEKKRGRPRKYQDDGENKHITYPIGDEKVCTPVKSDHREEENTEDTILSSGELGRGKRMKHKKDLDTPFLTSTKRIEHRDRVKLSAIRGKKSLTGVGLDELFAEDYSPPLEMLSQLYSLAVDPINANDFLLGNLKFFTCFKDFISSKLKEDQAVKSTGGKKGRKKKVKTSVPASFEMTEADHVQDSYWSDIVFEDPLVGDGLQAERPYEGEDQ